MKAYVASSINAASLIVLAGWGYSEIDSPAPSVLIPVFLGILLLTMNQGVMNGNKAHSHVAIVLTVLVLVALVLQFMGAMERRDNMEIVLVGIMLLTTIIAMIAFVRSFIEAKKKRQAKSKA